MSLTFRLLDANEVKVFASRSCALVGNQIPEAYLSAGRVVGTFKDGEMVGGWAFSYPSQGTLRCMKCVSYAQSVSEELNELISKGLLCEVTQIFLDPTKVNSRQSILFWKKLADDILSNCSPYILFGYRTQNEGLGRLYGRLSPRVLYSGPTLLNIQTHSTVTMLLLHRSKMRFLLLRNAGELVRRLIGKKRGPKRGGLGVEAVVKIEARQLESITR